MRGDEQEAILGFFIMITVVIFLFLALVLYENSYVASSDYTAKITAIKNIGREI